MEQDQIYMEKNIIKAKMNCKKFEIQHEEQERNTEKEEVLKPR